jgi:hypothetical protein
MEGIKQIVLRTPKPIYDAIFEASYQSRKQGVCKSINTIGVEALQMWLEAQTKSQMSARKPAKMEDIKRIALRTPKPIYDAIFEASHQSRKQGGPKSINTIGVEALQMWLEAQTTR